ncbi:MAG: hypothetical protein AAB486_03520 [Patescibacteria group bacterium]
MITLAYYSGKIESRGRECYVGDQKVACPASAKAYTQTGDKLDLLPPIPALEKRSDPLFFGLLLTLALVFTSLTIFRLKIFGKTLGEYLFPIRYFVLVAIVAVVWQYLFGLKLDDGMLSLRISQWVWELCVAASAYKLIMTAGFGYRHLLFLAVLYSLIIHGLKASVRYLFYGKTFLYLLDRFLYGSLLVVVIALVGGSLFIFFRRRGIIK